MWELFATLIVNPITNILLSIYHLLVALHVPFPLGFSIILLTICIRFILYPLTASQLKAAHKMQKLTPHLSKIKEQHKNDSKRLQEETMALYKEHGVNPAAGCLPVLIQLPVIWGLYSVLSHLVTLKDKALLDAVNSVAYLPSLHLSQPWETSFFGLPLYAKPSELFSTVGIAILFIPILTAVFQFLQSRMMITPTEKKPNAEPDFATAFQTQSLYLFPLMIGFFSFQFPVGLSLYWNTFTLFGMIQQYKMQGLGGLEVLFPKKK